MGCCDIAMKALAHVDSLLTFVYASTFHDQIPYYARSLMGSHIDESGGFSLVHSVSTGTRQRDNSARTRVHDLSCPCPIKQDSPT